MPKEKDEGYQTLDLEDKEVDQEIVVEAEEEEKKPTPPPKDEEELSKEDVSERVQRRIDRLTLRAKSAEERESALLSKLKQAEEQLGSMTKRAETAANTGLDLAETSAKEKLKLAQRSFQDAYDSGDKQALVDAQTAIAEATSELKFLAVQKSSRVQEETPKKQEQEEEPRRAAPKYDPKALAWAKANNSWFGTNRVMTAAALAVDVQLKEEGFDPTSDEFYDEVDKRIRLEFPHKFDEVEEKTPPTKPQQIVSGKSRGTGQTKTVIRLSPEQLRIARVMGMTPQEYAKELKRTEESVSDNGYVIIE